MTVKVDVIVPDAGPLISLAHAGRLDLLFAFGEPVAILDVVRRECLRKPDSPDHDYLAEWFVREAASIRIVETPFAALFDAAVAASSIGGRYKAARGLGDAAIAWLLPNLEEIALPGSVPLVLTEDRNVAVSLDKGPAHILSTRAWLIGLQAVGVIDSAMDLINKIARHGRVLSALTVDLASEHEGQFTSWSVKMPDSGETS